MKKEEIPERAILPDQLCNKDIPLNGWNVDAAVIYTLKLVLFILKALQREQKHVNGY